MSAKQLINGSTPYYVFDKVLLISDLHLGASNCQAEIVLDVIREHKEYVIIIIGDLFDSLSVRLKSKHWKILHKISKLDNVFWIKGNHDEPNPEFISSMLGITFCDKLEFVSGCSTFFAIHGDEFDDFITKNPVLTAIADYIYKFLQYVDPSHKLAKYAKHSSKSFLRNAEVVRQKAVEKYGEGKIVICGHTHAAIQSPEYCNTGSFTELPCSFITIEFGEIKLFYRNKYDLDADAMYTISDTAEREPN